MTRIVLALSALILCSCATHRHVYQPPSAVKLVASTKKVSEAVDKAHDHARKAQAAVTDATTRVKEVETETAKLQDVPVTLVAKINDLDQKLTEASNEQALLEVALKEADNAKAQVEKDKVDYFAAAKGLADSATAERDKRIAAEKALSYYRWHSWLFKIGAVLVIILVVVVAFLWFTGRLAGLASKFL